MMASWQWDRNKWKGVLSACSCWKNMEEDFEILVCFVATFICIEP